MTRPLTEFDVTLLYPRYAPRPARDVPGVEIDQSPYYCLKINEQWIPHLLGVFSALDQLDAWTGTESEIEDARNEILKLMSSFEEYCMLPLGTLIPFAGKYADLPTWALACDGSQYQRIDYPDLYATLESAFIVDSDNFNVPDTRSRSIVGSGQGGSLSNRAVGSTGGAETHTLISSEMPSHSHTYNQPTFNVDVESVGVPDPTGVGLPNIPTSTSSVGGDGAHNNMPPYVVLNHYIIARYP